MRTAILIVSLIVIGVIISMMFKKDPAPLEPYQPKPRRSKKERTLLYQRSFSREEAEKERSDLLQSTTTGYIEKATIVPDHRFHGKYRIKVVLSE